jgi:peptidoglycan/LPS O-acetylase OafA/YrhL
MHGIPLWTFLPVAQAWSLSLELMFYLMVPFLSRLLTKQLAVLLLVTTVLHFLIMKYAPSIYESGPHRFFPSALRFFLIGMLSARFYKWIVSCEISHQQLKKYALWAVAFHLALLAISHEASVWAAGLMLPFLFIFFSKSRWDRVLGEYSYTVYMVHVAVLYTLAFFPLLHHGTIVFIMSLLISYLMQKLLVNPIDNARRSYGAGRQR